MIEKKLNEDELKQVTGGDGKAPRGYTDWKKVYSYLQEHKNDLPEALKNEFESYEDEYDPHFRFFVEENLNTNDVILAAWNYGTVVAPC